MKNLKIIFVAFSFILLLQIIVDAQGFKGIVPLQMKCDEVEKILKVKACSLSELKYETETEKVKIYISTQNCEEIFQNRWDVPIGTVLGVIINFKKGIPLKEFSEDLTNFEVKKTDIGVFYSNTNKGMEIETIGDLVVSIWYVPTKNDNKVLCKSESKKPFK